MDSENEDILELEVAPEDISGMELDEPPPTSSLRDGKQVCGQAQPQVRTTVTSDSPREGEIQSDIPLEEKQCSEAREPKTKKKWKTKNPSVLERKRLKRKESRKLWKQRIRNELKAKVAQVTQMTNSTEPTPGTSTSSLDDTVRNRTYYDELVPSAVGTYYRPGPATVVRNILPAGYYSDSDNDDYIAEELMEPEDRPWMKGHKKPLPPPPVALAPPPKADEIVLIERSRQRYYESPSTKVAKYAVRDKWKLAEREILMKDQRETKFPRQLMPNYTILQVRTILNDPERVSQARSKHNYKYTQKRPNADEQIIQDFLREVRQTRVVCVNTEGTRAILTKEGQEERPLSMVTFAALNGVTLFFDDNLNVPIELMQLLSDVSVTKIGSGLSKEIAELERVGVTLDNWVEIGAVRLALYSHAWDPFKYDPSRPKRKPYTFGARRCGIEEQIEDLKSEGYLPEKYRRTDFKGGWTNTLNEGKVPYEMWPHIWENGRIPCAYMLMIVLDFARFRGLSEDTPAMGILHEALALCRGRDPEDFQRQLEPSIRPQNWWFALRGFGTQKERMRLPADCLETVIDRRTFADFVEPMTLEDPQVVTLRVYLRFFGPDPIPFPTYQEVGKDIRHALTTLRCICCGAKDHVSDCPRTTDPVCVYEHDGEEHLRPHNTEFCPVLHNYCSLCQTVGHLERVHLEERSYKTGRELRERYFKFMSVGAYTSIPYLAFHPEGYKKLTGAHWRRSYDGKAYRHATITRYVLGIGPEIQAKLRESIQELEEYRLSDSDRDWQLQAIRENIQKAETGETVPLPRDFLLDLRVERREKELLLKQTRYEADKDTRTAAQERASLKVTGENKKRRRKRNKKQA